MSKVILEYDHSTGMITDRVGMSGLWLPGATPFEPEVDSTGGTDADKTVELVKLGVSPDDIIKMKNHGVI